MRRASDDDMPEDDEKSRVWGKFFLCVAVATD